MSDIFSRESRHYLRFFLCISVMNKKPLTGMLFLTHDVFEYRYSRVYLNGQLCRMGLDQKVLLACIKSFGMQSVIYVLTNNLDGQTARLNAR
jgi:hypothetical protein